MTVFANVLVLVRIYEPAVTDGSAGILNVTWNGPAIVQSVRRLSAPTAVLPQTSTRVSLPDGNVLVKVPTSPLALRIVALKVMSVPEVWLREKREANKLLD